MDFRMRYDRWYRPLATLLGAGPKRTTIRVDQGALHVKHGWMFRIDLPLNDIRSVRVMSGRPLAWGVHPMGDAWMVNGSREGIVELRFSRPVTSKSVQLMSSTWGEVRCLYLSLEDPGSFVAAVKPSH
ncbi:hypothetical protein MSAS_48770 [Mycobacterium saskatchewanense]|uniref:Uncharacterized protein n=1 Tax=Mycobacterium saskatchewanense TaxID=220927 RepID=A0AAJ3NUI7_9MYCO|nr:hypothetical protein [Mycobacterium saskatchewanense]ORW74029.1 hypothetical protein AWC23_05790 [Mycobacterium saskatchewanense]BBX65703.1 hypothetical protein MSAS_48770 [Mycobacterium saskatchewanense]